MEKKSIIICIYVVASSCSTLHIPWGARGKGRPLCQARDSVNVGDQLTVKNEVDMQISIANPLSACIVSKSTSTLQNLIFKCFPASHHICILQNPTKHCTVHFKYCNVFSILIMTKLYYLSFCLPTYIQYWQTLLLYFV